MIIQISEAALEDLPAMVRLYLQSEEFHRGHRPDVFQKPALLEVQTRLEGFLREPLIHNLVAKMNGVVIGFLRYRIYEAPPVAYLLDQGARHAFVDELVVTADHRRNGFGKMLMAETERRLLEQGISYVQLNVFSFNLGARTLYEALGYEPAFLRLSKTLQATT